MRPADVGNKYICAHRAQYSQLNDALVVGKKSLHVEPLHDLSEEQFPFPSELVKRSDDNGGLAILFSGI